MTLYCFTSTLLQIFMQNIKNSRHTYSNFRPSVFDHRCFLFSVKSVCSVIKVISYEPNMQNWIGPALTLYSVTVKKEQISLFLSLSTLQHLTKIFSYPCRKRPPWRSLSYFFKTKFKSKLRCKTTQIWSLTPIYNAVKILTLRR